MSKSAARLPTIDHSPPTALWTAHEDERLRTLYPRYDLLRMALPHRSLSALKHRVRRLSIVRRRHIWTNLEIRRLHEAFENHVPDRELEALFPGLRLGQIKAKAGHIRASHRPFPAGHLRRAGFGCHSAARQGARPFECRTRSAGADWKVLPEIQPPADAQAYRARGRSARRRGQHRVAGVRIASLPPT